MHRYSKKHLSGGDLIRGLEKLNARACGTTAEIVAYIAEIDARDAYKDQGFESMHAYCMRRLHLSEDSAYKRIQAARAALEFPVLFEALADNRLNLSAICLLAPHLTRENIAELVARATHRSNAEIRQWLAERFATSVTLAARRQLEVRLPQPAAQQVQVEVEALETNAGRADVPEPTILPAATPEPLEYEMRFTISREDHERFRHAQALLSHAIPSGDVAAIYRRAIESVIAECEKRKAAATERPQAQRAVANGRHIPAHVRRAVWVRDGGRCTFMAPSGHRCGARRLLEFDHIVPVGRGGLSTAENLRLRCRAHNQDAARHVYGARFMRGKRVAAAAAAADRRPWAKAHGAGSGTDPRRGSRAPARAMAP